MSLVNKTCGGIVTTLWVKQWVKQSPMLRHGAFRFLQARRGEAKSWYSRAGLVIGSPIEQSNQFEFLRAGCIKGPRFPLLNHCVLLLLLLDIHTTAGSPHAALDLSFSAVFNYLLRLLYMSHVSISSTLWKSSRSRALSARGYVRKGSLTCLTTAT